MSIINFKKILIFERKSMIKGLRKSVVMVKCDRKSPFETAIFILKPRPGRDENGSDEDVIEKAYELIRSAASDKSRR